MLKIRVTAGKGLSLPQGSKCLPEYAISTDTVLSGRTRTRPDRIVLPPHVVSLIVPLIIPANPDPPEPRKS